MKKTSKFVKGIEDLFNKGPFPNGRKSVENIGMAIITPVALPLGLINLTSLAITVPTMHCIDKAFLGSHKGDEDRFPKLVYGTGAFLIPSMYLYTLYTILQYSHS